MAPFLHSSNCSTKDEDGESRSRSSVGNWDRSRMDRLHGHMDNHEPVDIANAPKPNSTDRSHDTGNRDRPRYEHLARTSTQQIDSIGQARTRVERGAREGTPLQCLHEVTGRFSPAAAMGTQSSRYLKKTKAARSPKTNSKIMPCTSDSPGLPSIPKPISRPIPNPRKSTIAATVAV